jgi:hypothetical protein
MQLSSLAVIATVALTLSAGAQSAVADTPSPITPKVNRVITLTDDPITTVPGVFYSQNFETIDRIKGNFHDTGGINEGRMRINKTDPFSGISSVQATYVAKEDVPEGADPGVTGWFWRFFGDNPLTHRIDDKAPKTRVFARWYHKFEEGFTSQEGRGTLPPKCGRMRCFEAPWGAVYTVLFWIEGKDGHISIQQHTRAPGVHREWLPNYDTTFLLNDPGNIGRWIHMELGVTLGEGLRSDRVQAWADGKLICDIDKQDLAGGYRELTLNAMSWDCYWNGGAPRAESRFYDDLVLADRPIGPTRTSVNPIIEKAESVGSEGETQKQWEVEVAQTKQIPMSLRDPARKEPEMEYNVVWSGSAPGKDSKIAVDTNRGNFIGPLTGKTQLAHNTLYSVRLRQMSSAGQWSDFSPWHAAFATIWAPDTKRMERTTAEGYLVGHEVSTLLGKTGTAPLSPFTP